jgi:hypothetical protein
MDPSDQFIMVGLIAQFTVMGLIYQFIMMLLINQNARVGSIDLNVKVDFIYLLVEMDLVLLKAKIGGNDLVIIKIYCLKVVKRHLGSVGYCFDYFRHSLRPFRLILRFLRSLASKTSVSIMVEIQMSGCVSKMVIMLSGKSLA